MAAGLGFSLVGCMIVMIGVFKTLHREDNSLKYMIGGGLLIEIGAYLSTQ